MTKDFQSYKDALAELPEAYTHMVRAPQGHQFSIHHDEASALERAAQIGGTVEPFIPNPTTYWNDSGESHYDH